MKSVSLKLGDVCGMCEGETRNAYRVLVVETEGTGPLEIAQCRWDVKV
jgi:recombinational DNA repair protein RecR